jgi:hypothetical protein
MNIERYQLQISNQNSLLTPPHWYSHSIGELRPQEIAKYLQIDCAGGKEAEKWELTGCALNKYFRLIIRGLLSYQWQYPISWPTWGCKWKDWWLSKSAERRAGQLDTLLGVSFPNFLNPRLVNEYYLRSSRQVHSSSRLTCNSIDCWNNLREGLALDDCAQSSHHKNHFT